MTDKPEWLKDMSVLSLKSGDKVILKTTLQNITWDQRKEITRIMEDLLGAPVIVLDAGFDIGVLRAYDDSV